MKVKRYLAATSREALRKVKADLGAEAIILSNRQTDAGVEIMALADTDMTSLVDTQQTGHLKTQEKNKPTASETNSAHHSSVHGAQNILPKTENETAVRIPENIVSEEFVQTVMKEIHAMKCTLEDQLATVAWGNNAQRNPEKMKVLRTLLNAGFSPLLSRRLVDKLSAGLDYTQSMKQAVSALTFNLHTASDDEMIKKGGVYALVGATGVGKTTTIAKLAARSVIRHGAEKVALLTTDSYRIGGHEQLRVYGRLLGLSVRNIQDADDLQLTLSELRNKHIVFIDTVGMSHRDQMMAEQIAMLGNPETVINKILVISAASSDRTLDEIITAYRKYVIHGCIVTKVDEAAGLGVALDAVIRRKLVLHYVTNGQKVPEDIHAANPRYLLHRIFNAKSGDSAFTLQDAEFALVMAGNNNPDDSESKIYAGSKHE
ncbi:flagellar biosynthesis protein FlhF [Nitrosomonas sp. Nm51]|uniref:flagellar biosynthesis protein FlhF n=1 Tax=Nitrosomonas sp. Nm51 TaxID=133720 RepID=UPI0008D02381|nr:flagellar biosynthesis protein FlhF [Nitrosomonas sp. Nm51]SEQ95114.1 flagellar biosynthesis protein FlhF [Nitrosomonas sp. Nm51]